MPSRDNNTDRISKMGHDSIGRPVVARCDPSDDEHHHETLVTRKMHLPPHLLHYVSRKKNQYVR
jgi:hypothetical protein